MSITNSPTTAIIPAHNEAETIGNVLKILSQVDCLSEIIVVDDGSTDHTVEEVQMMTAVDPRIRVLVHSTNLGKGQAIFSGWRASQSKNLLMLDSDLMGLKDQHVLDLIRPVMEGRVDMTIGQFKKGYWRTDLAHWATPWLSGQRCLRGELLQQISSAAASGYGIETALTVAAQEQGWRCERVSMLGVWHPTSENRLGFFRGLGKRALMYTQIIRAWYLAGGLRRMLGLRRRSLRY